MGELGDGVGQGVGGLGGCFPTALATAALALVLVLLTTMAV